MQGCGASYDESLGLYGEGAAVCFNTNNYSPQTLATFRSGPDGGSILSYFPTSIPLAYSQVEDTNGQSSAMNLGFSINWSGLCGDNASRWGGRKLPPVTF